MEEPPICILAPSGLSSEEDLDASSWRVRGAEVVLSEGMVARRSLAGGQINHNPKGNGGRLKKWKGGGRRQIRKR